MGVDPPAYLSAAESCLDRKPPRRTRHNSKLRRCSRFCRRRSLVLSLLTATSMHRVPGGCGSFCGDSRRQPSSVPQRTTRNQDGRPSKSTCFGMAQCSCTTDSETLHGVLWYECLLQSSCPFQSHSVLTLLLLIDGSTKSSIEVLSRDARRHAHTERAILDSHNFEPQATA
jgi:hypothetical protein